VSPDPAYSLSITSTTIGRADVRSSAAEMIGENSRSVISTLVSACSSMKAMASASSRVLSAFSTAPDIGTPKCASYSSGVFASITETVSPRLTPSAESPAAKRSARLRVSRHV
jgi:hypothetical protein